MSSSEAQRALVTATRLVKLAETSPLAGPSSSSSHDNKATTEQQRYRDFLKLRTTLKHVGELLDQVEESGAGGGAVNGCASGSSSRAPENSLPDLRARLTTLTASLHANPVTRPSPKADINELDDLKPSLPPAPVIAAPPPASTPEEASADDADKPTNEAEPEPKDEVPPPSIPVLPPASPLLPPTPSPANARAALLPSEPASTLRSRPSAPSRTDSSSPPPPSTSTSTLMEHHTALQSSLISSLTSMSTQLKTNSLTLSENLAKDKEVMEKAQEKLGGNLEGMKKTGKGLREYSGKQRGGTCMMIGIVGVVAVAWVVMFFFIKVT
ncbi:vesicle transport protein, Use1 family protein [Pseudohyphozyma bogoriensis]|nr:vesicle transport protein, Use1 family protein [Pseudohyphozyma bogoriensis]